LHAATVKERTLGQNQTETVACFIECLRLTIRKDLLLANKHRREREAEVQREREGMSKYALAHLVEKEIGMLPEDRKNFSLIGLQATEVSRRIDKLNQIDHEAALRLAGKCYQLVALTDLIVVGEIDPTKNQHSNTVSQKGAPKKRDLRSEASLPPVQGGAVSRELSVGSLRYLHSLALREKQRIPTVSMNVLNHTLFGESRLMSSSERGAVAAPAPTPV
jgi:hypothetical protein